MHFRNRLVRPPLFCKLVTFGCQFVKFLSFFFNLFSEVGNACLGLIDLFVDDLYLYIPLPFLLDNILKLSLFIHQTKILILNIFFISIEGIFNFKLFSKMLF